MPGVPGMPNVDFDAIAKGMAMAVPFAGFLGLEITEVGPGEATVVLPRRQELNNHVGSQHAGALFTAAELVHAPVSMALATALAPAAARGRYLAVFQYSFTVGSMVAPAFFTTLFEAHRALPWLALGALNLAAVAATAALERRISPR